jgi:hypothetical protein
MSFAENLLADPMPWRFLPKTAGLQVENVGN